MSPEPRFNPFVVADAPQLYDQIGDSIGADAADKLIADFGGRRLYIPIAPARGDLITRSIGLLAALTMARAFGGDRILIPATCSHARRRARIVRCALKTSASRASHASSDAPSATFIKSSPYAAPPNPLIPPQKRPRRSQSD